MLKIKLSDKSNKFLVNYYEKNKYEKKYKNGNMEVILNSSDSGLDLIIPEDIVIPKNSINNVVNLLIKIEAVYEEPQGLNLYTRSSIGKLGLMLSNSVGVIDYDYRGDLKASINNITNEDIKLKAGERYFQLCQGDLKPFQSYFLVDELSETKRNEGGFGSTGSYMEKK